MSNHGGSAKDVDDNYQWYWGEIKKAASIERLELLGQEIAYDTWGEMEYTQDKPEMMRLRGFYRERLLELKGDHSA